MAAITCQCEREGNRTGLGRKSVPPPMDKPGVPSCGNLDSFSVSLPTRGQLPPGVGRGGGGESASPSRMFSQPDGLQREKRLLSQ